MRHPPEPGDTMHVAVIDPDHRVHLTTRVVERATTRRLALSSGGGHDPTPAGPLAAALALLDSAQWRLTQTPGVYEPDRAVARGRALASPNPTLLADAVIHRFSEQTKRAWRSYRDAESAQHYAVMAVRPIRDQGVPR